MIWHRSFKEIKSRAGVRKEAVFTWRSFLLCYLNFCVLLCYCKFSLFNACQIKIWALSVLSVNHSMNEFPRTLSSIYCQIYTWEKCLIKLGPTDLSLSNVLQNSFYPSVGLIAHLSYKSIDWYLCLSSFYLLFSIYSLFTTSNRYLGLVVIVSG